MNTVTQYPANDKPPVFLKEDMGRALATRDLCRAILICQIGQHCDLAAAAAKLETAWPEPDKKGLKLPPIIDDHGVLSPNNQLWEYGDGGWAGVTLESIEEAREFRGAYIRLFREVAELFTPATFDYFRHGIPLSDDRNMFNWATAICDKLLPWPTAEELDKAKTLFWSLPREADRKAISEELNEWYMSELYWREFETFCEELNKTGYLEINTHDPEKEEMAALFPSGYWEDEDEPDPEPPGGDRTPPDAPIPETGRRQLSLADKMTEAAIKAAQKAGVDIKSDDVKGFARGLMAGAISDDDKEETTANILMQCPEELLRPAGLAGDICDWINRTAGCPQPLLTVGAVLTALGAIYGRKVRDRSNGRSNLFGMGVAHSSAGKDHAPDCINRLIVAAGGESILGGSSVTGDSALETALGHWPVQLFLWDEIGHMFATIKGAAGSNPHLSTIAPTLMELYSSPHKVYLGKQRANEAKRRIDQPHVCLWGYTSPGVLYQGITEAELRDGFLGRIMTFISHDRPLFEMRDVEPPPAELVDKVKAWLQRDIQPAGDTGNIMAITQAQQMLYRDTPEAEACFKQFAKEAHGRMIGASKTDDPCQFLWGKALQNARRVALIEAASEQLDGGSIEEKNAEYGCKLTRFTVECFAVSIRENAFVSESEKQCRRFMAKLKAVGGAMEHSKALKYMRITADEFDKKVIRTLEQRADIETERIPTKGRPRIIYRMLN